MVFSPGEVEFGVFCDGGGWALGYEVTKMPIGILSGVGAERWVEEYYCEPGGPEPCFCEGGLVGNWCTDVGWTVTATNTTLFIPQTVEVKVTCVVG